MEVLLTNEMLTITKLKCLLENKQDRIDALEKQVQDLHEDRKFLRTQIEKLTSVLSARFCEGVEKSQEKWKRSWTSWPERCALNLVQDHLCVQMWDRFENHCWVFWLGCVRKSSFCFNDNNFSVFTSTDEALKGITGGQLLRRQDVDSRWHSDTIAVIVCTWFTGYMSLVRVVIEMPDFSYVLSCSVLLFGSYCFELHCVQLTSLLIVFPWSCKPQLPKQIRKVVYATISFTFEYGFTTAMKYYFWWVVNRFEVFNETNICFSFSSILKRLRILLSVFCHCVARYLLCEVLVLY